MSGKPFQIAARIQQDLILGRLLPGEFLGSEQELRARFAVGRETLREAIAILEMRGLGRMRRGRHGGFVTAIPDLSLVARSFSGHALLVGTTSLHFSQALQALERIREVGMQATGVGTRESAPDPGTVIVNTLSKSLATLEEHFRPGNSSPYLPRDRTQRITIGSRRAGQVARNIVAQLAQTPLQPGSRFGSERDLSHRFAVSKSIARQVVRLLEDLQVARCERGSGRGIFMGPPATHHPAQTMGLYWLTHAATPASSWTIAQCLRVESAQLAARQSVGVREVVCRERSTLLRELSAGQRPHDLASLFLVDRAIESAAGNPLLTLILEALKTYSALACPLRDRMLARFVSAHGPRYVRLMRDVVEAISHGDPMTARQTQHIANRFFSDHVRSILAVASQEPV